VALSVLSGIEPVEFVRAVLQADAARLTSIPGIGRKTAERITLELRDRLPAIEPSLAAAASEPSTPASGLRDDVMSALVNLGYQRPAVEKAVDAAAKAAGGAEPPAFEDWLRQSLRHLSR
jgi:holliday junction DNA helicase RuvA